MPIPTLVRSTTSGIALRAFCALEATLISSSFTLTTNKLPGSRDVVPTPTNEVDAIPIACDVPAPA